MRRPATVALNEWLKGLYPAHKLRCRCGFATTFPEKLPAILREMPDATRDEEHSLFNSLPRVNTRYEIGF